MRKRGGEGGRCEVEGVRGEGRVRVAASLCDALGDARRTAAWQENKKVDGTVRPTHLTPNNSHLLYFSGGGMGSPSRQACAFLISESGST
jgi:hypothetical protein